MTVQIAPDDGHDLLMSGETRLVPRRLRLGCRKDLMDAILDADLERPDEQAGDRLELLRQECLEPILDVQRREDAVGEIDADLVDDRRVADDRARDVADPGVAV